MAEYIHRLEVVHRNRWVSVAFSLRLASAGLELVSMVYEKSILGVVSVLLAAAVLCI